jgi:hypothetical protein
MNKFFLTALLFVVAACFAAFAQGVPSPSSPRLMIDAAGTLVSSSNPLPVDAVVNISSITVSVFPVYADSTGTDATATVDLNNRVVISDEGGVAALLTAAASDTLLITSIDLVTAEITAAAATNTADMASLSGDISAVKTGIDTTNAILYPPTDWQQQTITLVADTAQDIVSEITGTRKNILLKAQEDKPFWVSIDGAAVIGTNGTLVNSWVKLDVPLSVTVSVIASEAFAISVTESGW